VTFFFLPDCAYNGFDMPVPDGTAIPAAEDLLKEVESKREFYIPPPTEN
jgi:hypothetical protein